MNIVRKVLNTLGFSRGTIGFEALIAVAWRVSLVIALLSFGIYIAVQQLLIDRVVAKIELSAETRAFKENQLFERIEMAHNSAAKALTELMTHRPGFEQAELDALFYEHGDGTLRTRPELFDGTIVDGGLYVSGTGGLIKGSAALTDDRKRLFLNAFKVATQVGAAHYPNLLSYYFFTPNSDIIIRAPDREDKLLFYRRDAPPDLSIEGMELLNVTLPENNPDRQFRCTSLQPITSDPDANIWTTGCHLPFDWNGQHVGAFGSSLRLTELMSESVADPMTDAQNMIISEDGKLIAHPVYTQAGSDIENNVDIAASSNSDVKSIYQNIQANSGKSLWSATLNDVGLYIAVGRIEGFNGYYVVAYPKAFINAQASNAALKILYAGLAALVIALVTLTSTVRRTVTEPLNQLRDRTRQLALGKFETKGGPENNQSSGEIQALAASTERMARELAQIIGNLEDTVERRTRDLASARDDAERASAAKTNFLANMSHEIRTPLTGVIGMLDLLSQESLPTTAKSYLTMADKSSTLLLNLVNDILDISRLEAGKFAVRKSTVSINGAIEDTSESLMLLAKQKYLSLRYKTDLTEPLWVSTDLKIIRQILINLVGNAIKFTENGSIEVHLEADVQKADDATGTAFVTFSVQDTGPGLTNAQIGKLFDRFEQLDNHHGSSTTQKGTGLGLSIVKELVELLDGTIECSSTPGIGTTFTVKLPLALSQPSPQQIAAASGLKAAPPDGESLKGIKLLGVDDNSINRVIIQKLCERLGAEIRVFESGAEMIAYVSIEGAADDIDALLMDINMPGMDGLETLTVIRNLPGRVADLPAIALTADAIEGSAERVKARGMNGFISKPVDPEVLVSTILELMPEWTAPDNDASGKT